MSENPIQIPAGTALVQLLLIKSKIPSFSNQQIQQSTNRGSFGSTGQIFKKIQPTLSTINTNHIQNLAFSNEDNFIHTEELLQQYTIPPTTGDKFILSQDLPDIHPIIHLDNLLNPTNISIDNFNITLTGSPVDKTQQLYELQCFE